MDTSEKAIPYIATWTKNGQTLDDKEAAERGKIMNDVSRVANEFIQTISKEINQYRERDPEIKQAEVKQDYKNPVEMVEQKNVVPVGSLWIDKKDGKVKRKKLWERDTNRITFRRICIRYAISFLTSNFSRCRTKKKRNVPCPRIEKCRKGLMLYVSTNTRIV